jgi:hypothetical protein
MQLTNPNYAKPGLGRDFIVPLNAIAGYYSHFAARLVVCHHRAIAIALRASGSSNRQSA